MRVLQVSNDLGEASGVGYFVRRMSGELAKLGVETAVVASVAELEAVAERPDVVHVHGIWLGLHRAAARWACAKGVPLVWSTHGMTAPWAMHHKWWKKLPAWWLYQKRDLHRATAIHCTTDLEVEWNRHHGFRNCFVIPLGTDIPVNQSIHQSNNRTIEQSPNPSISQSLNRTIEQSNNPTIFRVLFVGRIYPVKGLVNLVRAAAVLQSGRDGEPSPSAVGGGTPTLPGSGFGGPSTPAVEFRLVGPDQAGHRAELENECRRLGVDNVESVGEKSGAELAAEYDACDVLVLPSFTENFGGVVVDALAHGKPVVASRFTPWEVLAKRGCGWWVDNSPESLAKTIDEVAQLPREELSTMGRRGRALVEAEYTWPAVAERMRAEYERIVRTGCGVQEGEM